jgi:hypothetical protein
MRGVADPAMPAAAAAVPAPTADKTVAEPAVEPAEPAEPAASGGAPATGLAVSHCLVPPYSATNSALVYALPSVMSMRSSSGG